MTKNLKLKLVSLISALCRLPNVDPPQPCQRLFTLPMTRISLHLSELELIPIVQMAERHLFGMESHQQSLAAEGSSGILEMDVSLSKPALPEPVICHAWSFSPEPLVPKAFECVTTEVENVGHAKSFCMT